MTEMAWDYVIDRMPGQADEYHLLPLTLYGGTINCQVHFLADAEGIVREGQCGRGVSNVEPRRVPLAASYWQGNGVRTLCSTGVKLVRPDESVASPVTSTEEKCRSGRFLNRRLQSRRASSTVANGWIVVNRCS